MVQNNVNVLRIINTLANLIIYYRLPKYIRSTTGEHAEYVNAIRKCEQTDYDCSR